MTNVCVTSRRRSDLAVRDGRMEAECVVAVARQVGVGQRRWVVGGAGAGRDVASAQVRRIRAADGAAAAAAAAQRAAVRRPAPFVRSQVIGRVSI